MEEKNNLFLHKQAICSIDLIMNIKNPKKYQKKSKEAFKRDKKEYLNREKDKYFHFTRLFRKIQKNEKLFLLRIYQIQHLRNFYRLATIIDLKRY